MIVYVVQWFTDDGYADEVVGIYSTRERAEAAAADDRARYPKTGVAVWAFRVDSTEPLDDTCAVCGHGMTIHQPTCKRPRCECQSYRPSPNAASDPESGKD